MTRRKDGLYQEGIVINGKRKFFYGHSKAEVLKKIRAYQDEQEHGRAFDVVAEEWWSEAEEKIAYNTAKSYKPAYKRAAEWFKGVPMQRITPAQINREIVSFAKKGYADKTVRTQLMVISLIYQYAVRAGDAVFSPVRDLSVPDRLPKEKRKMPTEDDIRRVKASTECTFGMFAFWALYTGLRRGELLALEWKDVDVKNRLIRVNKSLFHMNNKPMVKLPKTEASVGTVPLLDALRKKIKPHKSGLVFPNANGAYITETQFQKLWKQYAAESGVTATPHQFRHAYATMLFEAGIPPEEMQILLRHAQLSTTMDIYTEIRDNKIKAVHNKVYKVDIV